MLDGQITRDQTVGAGDEFRRMRANEAREVELKLLVPPGMLGQLRESPAILRRARNHGVARRLEAIYYDTANRALFKHGLSLRVRRVGRRFVQTLKREPLNGHVFVRGEWESPVASATPDVSLLPVSEIGPPLSDLNSAALKPVFITKVRRRTQHLDIPGAEVEVAFDDGTIEADGRSESLTEIELELKAGEPRVLFDLGIELLDIAPLRIGTRSKSDRGYDLAFGAGPRPTKPTAPPVSADHTVDDVVGLLLGSCQQHLLANQPVAEDGRDTEGVHQMRVGLRRLRTALSLLHRELAAPTLRAFMAESKWLAQVLGTARDWDVLVSDTLRGPSAALASAAIDFEAFRCAAEPHRLAAYDALREAVTSQRYNRVQLELGHWIESRGWRNDLDRDTLGVLLEPAPSLAARVLTRLHRKALKQGAHFRHLDHEARHRVRITLKKLRYALEFFLGCLREDASASEYLQHLSRLQNALGYDNDAAMSLPLLRTLAQGPTGPEVQRSIGAVIGWQAHERVAGNKPLLKHWRGFKTLPGFWRD
jgi:triphosphatase